MMLIRAKVIALGRLRLLSLLPVFALGLTYGEEANGQSLGAKSRSDLALISAVRHQHKSVIADLLEKKVDVNVAQPDGATALHWAVHRDDLETAKLLIEAGADIEATNDFGVMPLSLACTNGSAAMIELLLNAGADPNVALATGETPLMTAAHTGNLKSVEILLGRGANVNAKEPIRKQTALMRALGEKQTDVVQKLIEHGVDVNAATTLGFTPLLFAARHGDLEAIRMLLDAGADINAKSKGQLSALHVAVQRGHVDVAIELLERRANLNDDSPGYTALHWVVGTWETELNGANGITAPKGHEWYWMPGIKEGKFKLVKELLEHGADPNARLKKSPDRFGYTTSQPPVGSTAYTLAAFAGDAEVMQLLYENGADPKLKPDNGQSAIVIAAGVTRTLPELLVSRADLLTAMKKAVEHDVDVNELDNKGNTALHGAARLGSVEMVDFLYEHGADMTVKNKAGRNARSMVRPNLVAGNGDRVDGRAVGLRIEILSNPQMVRKSKEEIDESAALGNQDRRISAVKKTSQLRKRKKRGITTPLLVQLQVADGSSPSANFNSTNSFRELIDNYCVVCHDGTNEAVGLNLDALNVANVSENAEVWEKVVHKLRTGDMPPPDETQPTTQERRALLSWLVTSLDVAAAADPNPGRPAVHRLNRAEYANAIKDLLAVEIDSRSLLPPDGSDFGFDNIADSLNVSPLLLERYIMAASKISRQAIGDLNIRPSSTIYKVSKLLLQQERMGEDLPFGSRGGTSVPHHFPLDGEYVIKVKIQSPKTETSRVVHQRSTAPEQLEVRVDGKRVGEFTIGKPKGAQWSYQKNDFKDDMPESEKKVDKEEVGMSARSFEVRFPAKAGTRTVAVSFLKRTLAYEGVRPRNFPAFYTFSKLQGTEPGVIDFEIAGPFDVTGVGKERPSRQKIFTRYPTGSEDEVDVATEILSNLARRAYRRPVTTRDMDTLLTFYAQGRQAGNFEDGIRSAIERILVSPNFLFRIEANSTDVAPGTAYYLSDLELASRLSFFLWSSIPDDELLGVAERGELKDPEALKRQVRRMLADDRSESLVANFATQWLQLRKLEALKPDVNIFPEFDDNLREAFERETELFFASQLREDRSVVELLSADYTFLNERLAAHYQIPGIYGSHFRRVNLGDQRIGGLLGHGSILTVTSYATRTSPVIRGKWLLQNILGSPAPPPPPDIPDLPEVGAGGQAATIREKLEMHLALPTCASCHVKLDPLGLALENFDAIGKWRTSYGSLLVDSRGELPDGTVLAGPRGLRDVLLVKDDEFVRTVIQKLLTYALGRGIEHYDQPAVRQIAREAEPDGYRWSSIILGIVKSTPFQMSSSKPTVTP